MIAALKISDFQMKDVVNVVDGKKLGQVSDLELDLVHGYIEAIVVPCGGRLLGLFGNGAELIIPWKNIVKIGLDVVLVRLDNLHTLREEEMAESSYFSRTYHR